MCRVGLVVVNSVRVVWMLSLMAYTVFYYKCKKLSCKLGLSMLRFLLHCFCLHNCISCHVNSVSGCIGGLITSLVCLVTNTIAFLKGWVFKNKGRLSWVGVWSFPVHTKL